MNKSVGRADISLLGRAGTLTIVVSSHNHDIDDNRESDCNRL
jgi:hypothetical protein